MLSSCIGIVLGIVSTLGLYRGDACRGDACRGDPWGDVLLGM